MEAIQSELIGKIYEAAIFKDRWPEVVAAIGRYCDLWGGALTWEVGGERRWMVTPNLLEVLGEFVAEGWAAKNTRLERTNRAGQFSFVREADLFTAEERRTMPIYRDFFTPRGLGCATSTLIAGPENTGMSLIFEQTLIKGNIGDEAIRILNSLRPHIARSLVLATELDQQKADLLTTGLSAIGAPAAIVQDNGCVLSANPLFTTALRRVSIRARDRIFLHDESANRLLHDALASIASDQIKSIPLPATEEEQACIVHVIPLCGNALDFSPRGTAIVLIAQPAAAQANDLRILKGLYDLTRSEARIAIEIQSGMALPEIARRLGISYETARSVAKAIYAKTGSSGQSDLVRRLSVVARYTLSSSPQDPPNG
ncbi:LuxR family transcriptional regulator [Shinella sp. CPCC 101442]|uniref:helix-turn-helix transcriptional regulator n=1 Tax=Shinella sp. CPCC 101442 TaxID=2932265 RepID=UPI002152E7A1|nr:LuxR family transcriptional regulator [Shinella sp. CPCC 101442]MCR6498513.1 LuxR family transcriptional regulator [Shinella sp. CPCC 101442]